MVARWRREDFTIFAARWQPDCSALGSGSKLSKAPWDISQDQGPASLVFIKGTLSPKSSAPRLSNGASRSNASPAARNRDSASMPPSIWRGTPHWQQRPRSSPSIDAWSRRSSGQRRSRVSTRWSSACESPEHSGDPRNTGGWRNCSSAWIQTQEARQFVPVGQSSRKDVFKIVPRMSASCKPKEVARSSDR